MSTLVQLNLPIQCFPFLPHCSFSLHTLVQNKAADSGGSNDAGSSNGYICLCEGGWLHMIRGMLIVALLLTIACAYGRLQQQNLLQSLR